MFVYADTFLKFRLLMHHCDTFSKYICSYKGCRNGTYHPNAMSSESVYILLALPPQFEDLFLQVLAPVIAMRPWIKP